MTRTTQFLRQARWLLVAFTIVSVFAGAATLISTIAREDSGRQGFAVIWPDTAVTAVLPGSAAAQAGIQAGDVLLLDRMSLRDIMDVYDYVIKIAGADEHVVVMRGHTPIASVVRPRPYFADRRLIGFAILSFLEGLFVAALVVLVLVRSPSGTAVAFWAFAFGWTFSNAPFGYHTPDWLAIVGLVLNDGLATALVTAGAIVLMLHATLDVSRRARYERAAIAYGILIGAVVLAADASLLVLRSPAPPALMVAARDNSFLGTAIVVVLLVGALVRSSGIARVRLRWLSVGLGAIALQSVLQPVILLIPGSVYAIWPQALYLSLTLAGFCALAFAIVRSDLFDVGFVVNRTAIYAVMTALLVAAFAGLNWIVGQALKSTGLALPFEVILAGALGLSLNLIHRRIDRAVDLLFFRKRYDAQRRLRRVARGLVHAAGLDVVAESVVL